MAGIYTPALQSTGVRSLADYRHASKVFRSNAYANSPKFKYLFHVYFDINRAFIGTQSTSPQTLGLLVKNINLPKFTIQLAEMNQYNRRRYVQTKLTYDPIQIAFHDDNIGQVRDMWYNYFSYYYYDPNNPQNEPDEKNAASLLNIRNTYATDISGIDDWGYTAETPNAIAAESSGVAKAPYFKSIRIYGFNQHTVSLYELVNPIIERFEHDTYDYTAGTGVMENRMIVRYETVKYQQGALNGQKPSEVVSGFATPGNYDLEPSPIMRVPNGNVNYPGRNGMENPGNGFLKNIPQPFSFPAPGAAAGNGVSNVTAPAQQEVNGTVNAYQAQNFPLSNSVQNAITNPTTVRGGYNFPAAGGTNYGPTPQVVQPSEYIEPETRKAPYNNPVTNLNNVRKTFQPADGSSGTFTKASN